MDEVDVLLSDTAAFDDQVMPVFVSMIECDSVLNTSWMPCIALSVVPLMCCLCMSVRVCAK